MSAHTPSRTLSLVRDEPSTAELCHRSEEAAHAYARVLECELSAKMGELIQLARDACQCRSASAGARNIGQQVVTKLEVEHGALRSIIEREAK